jgi:transposase
MNRVAWEPADAATRLWNLQGFGVEDSEIEEEARGQDSRKHRVKLIRVFDQRKHQLCPCGSRDHEVLFEESAETRFRDCGLGDVETYIVVRPKRLRCGAGSRVEVFPWAAPGHRMTRRFFERVAALCVKLPVAEVARLAGLSWNTTARVDADAIRLALGGDTPSLGKLRWLGIDEVSRTGGNVFFTIVTDLESGRVVYLGDGKREEALAGFFDQLGPRACKRIQGVVSDLAASYLNVIVRYVPHAKHAIDRFHIVQWVNRALSDVRRRIFGGAPKDGLGRELKVQKWVLVSARENLKPESERLLQRLEELNQPLYRAYLLKEELRALLHKTWTDFVEFRTNLRAWCEAATEASPEFAKVATRLTQHEDKVVDGFLPGMKMGIVEAINGKVALLRWRARGYRIVNYFKLKIFQACSLGHNPWASVIL